MEAYPAGFVLRSGSQSYRIVRNIAQGIAFSYEAVDQASQKCLVKAYGDPVPDSHICPWFPAYRSLQQEIQKRLRNIEYQAIQTLDEFVAKNTYHQVIEWAVGRSLEDLYAAELQTDDSCQKPLLVAKVMMFALSQVHAQGIVHRDQKLANFYAEEDRTISARYRIKIADFDMSLLADRPMPNPGRVGTFGYFSPEYFRHERQTLASDVFTVGGIMLFELLAGCHPFENIVGAGLEDDANRRILHAVETNHVPKIADVAPNRAKHIPRAILEINHACFANRPEERPSAKEVHRILLGSPVARRLVLIGGPGQLKWRLEKSAIFSRQMCEALFHAGHNTISSNQATFEPNEDRTEWYVIPQSETVNKTMLDGKEVSARTVLKTGMKLQVGNPASGRIGFEAEVSFEMI